MALSEEQREQIEEAVLELHFAASKCIESGKDIHQKLLDVGVEEAIDLLESLKEELADDVKMYDYKMHFLMPFHIYELLKLRKEAEVDE